MWPEADQVGEGEHTGIPRGGGHFRLVKKLYSGNSG